MIWIDYSIIGIIAFSLVIGISRGFVKEVLALATWGIAIWVGIHFNREISLYLAARISHPSARIAAAFAILVVATLIFGAIVGFLLNELVKKTGLSGTDRFIGMFFGIARGMLVVSVLILFAGFTPLPEDPWWKESTLIPHFQKMALWLRTVLPSGIAGLVKY
jgi:membrane protein required for colicin V production